MSSQFDCIEIQVIWGDGYVHKMAVAMETVWFKKKMYICEGNVTNQFKDVYYLLLHGTEVQTHGIFFF